jgi:hypothetical protein
MYDPDATSSTDENIERVRALIPNNRRVTTNEQEHYMHISHGYFHEIIHKGLGFRNVSARWVPKHLTAWQKGNRFAFSQSVLDHFYHDLKAF